MDKKKVIIIGIAGASASGKSLLANTMKTRHGPFPAKLRKTLQKHLKIAGEPWMQKLRCVMLFFARLDVVWLRRIQKTERLGLPTAFVDLQREESCRVHYDTKERDTSLASELFPRICLVRPDLTW